MLCSVLIPSRKRFDQLLKCIESVYQSADMEDMTAQFEVIVRFHKSDLEARDRITELDQFSEIDAIWGEDHNGYQSLGQFWYELVQVAQGDWVWHINDDMTIATLSDCKWNIELSKVPDMKHLVQPQWHNLNTSHYGNDARGPAPIHPRTALGKEFLEPDCGAAVDATIYRELVEERKWPVYFLPGIEVQHHWGGVESHVK